MKYSIIITFYQNTTMLINCIHNLIPTLLDINNTEIIIVNDNPTIKLKEKLADFCSKSNIILFENSENIGYSAACNKGAAMSRGKYLIFLDCDIIVSSTWLDELQKTYDCFDNCGAVASTILDLSNNQIVYAGMKTYFCDTIKPFQGGYITNKYFLSDHMSEIVTSGCMMVSKKKFYDINGFNEQLYNSCCDLDISMKLNSKAWHNYVSSNSIVYHRGNVSGEIRFSSHISARTLFFMNWNENITKESNLSILSKLYSFAKISDKEYLIINMSDSLYSMDYILCLISVHHVNTIDEYKLKPVSNNKMIFLTDYFAWDICSLKTPIIYFVDDYRRLLNNYLWFKKRACQFDVIADKNGNIYNLGN